jgi:hypothetical protein
MKKHILLLTIPAFILVCSPIAARAQQSPGTPSMQQPPVQQPLDSQSSQQQPKDHENPGMIGRGPGMMGQGGVMGRGPGMMGQGGTMSRGMMGQDSTMGRGEMRHQGMMGPVVMRIVFALMDSDGDGTISLQEFQLAHERIFKAMDTNRDGVLTMQEMQAFMAGPQQ